MADIVETLNMQTVTLERVLQQITDQLEDEDYTPVTIIGKSGIGKTESIANLAKELGVGFQELRLSHYNETDLIGLPYTEVLDGSKEVVTRHAFADLLPPSNDKGKGILLLDEVTSSQKSMRSAVYQLMDSSRKLGKYKLPEKWLIVACGNGPDDGGDFRGIEAAFCSRGFCWRVEPNFSVWRKWAAKAKIHPAVIAYLAFRPDRLHCMDVQNNPYDMIACPRSWVKLSTQLTNMERRNKRRQLAKVKAGKMSANQVKDYIDNDDDLEFSAAGCVGASEGPAFAVFYRYNKVTIEVDDILNGRVDPNKMRDISEEVLYLTAQNLVSAITKDIENSQVYDKDGVPKPDEVKEDCFNRLVNAMKWCCTMEDYGIKLDVALGIIYDLKQAVPTQFNTILIGNEEFSKRCPELDTFVVKHIKLLSDMVVTRAEL